MNRLLCIGINGHRQNETGIGIVTNIRNLVFGSIYVVADDRTILIRADELALNRQGRRKVRHLRQISQGGILNGSGIQPAARCGLKTGDGRLGRGAVAASAVGYHDFEGDGELLCRLERDSTVIGQAQRARNAVAGNISEGEGLGATVIRCALCIGGKVDAHSARHRNSFFYC